jgi:CheY-like chemotaxis protein
MVDGKPIILVCDDTPADCEMVQQYLPEQFAFASVSDQLSAREFLSTRHVYLALVDLFLDKNDKAPHGIAIQDDYQHVPIVLMSGQNPDRVQQALRQSKNSQHKWLSKDLDLRDRAATSEKLHDCLQQHYNLEVEFASKQNSVTWESIAARLAGADRALREEFTLEVEHLARKAFYDWDVHKHAHVRLGRIDIVKELTSGSHSCVLLLRPYTIAGESQADVIFKISCVSAHSPSEHRKFDEFKNLIGGYGLRERRYARTCHLQGQVYAVPYYSFDDTKTYADFYRALAGGSDDEAALEAVTRALFNNTLRPINRRFRTSHQPARSLSEYYGTRIKLERRAQAIKCDLTADKAFSHLRVKRETLEVMVNGKVREFTHPAPCVLVRRAYKHVDEKVPTAIRHGDFHASNVLVDEQRKMCWFIDYERFDVDHFALVDHVEFESSVLFDLMDIGEMSAGYLVRFIESISQPVINQIVELAGVDALVKDKLEAGKALAAIRAIRDSAHEVNGLDAARSYYHALMYEALRVAGHRDTDARRRWHALLAAAVLLEQVESS